MVTHVSEPGSEPGTAEEGTTVAPAEKDAP
ncbi:hypothetical protein QF026_000452 [Streptomyces aurantiacus]|nr:hypothetical protein [Streptomyces aurantiacus]